MPYQPIPSVEYKDVKTGLICQGAVSENQMPLDAVTESINFHFDRLGAATVRSGLTRLGNQISAGTNILGLFEFRDSGSGTNNRIIAVDGTVAYYLSGGTWTSKRTGLTSGSKARFSTFLDYVFMVNGTEATAIWDGATANSFVTTGNASNAPTGTLIENFRSRMWIAGNSTYPDRLYYSSLPSSVTTPIITWNTDVSTGDWIDISPSDGENITALRRDKKALLVFKNNNLYRVYSINETEPDPVIPVGTYSNESVVTAKDGTYFHHPSGFYKYQEGAVNEISKPIQDIVDAITVANYSSICGWQDGDHVYWSVGDVTIGSTTFTNLVVRYTISSKVWTHYTYPTKFLFASRYNDGTTLFRLVGDNDGNILKVNVGSDDNNTPINASLNHRWYNVDGLISTQKNLPKLVFSHTGGAGTRVSYQVQDDPENDWSKTIGQFKSRDTVFSATGIKGRKCRFRLSATNVGTPFVYYGFEIITPTAEQLQQRQ